MSRCGNQSAEESIGLDVERPRFSWMLGAEEREVMQVYNCFGDYYLSV